MAAPVDLAPAPTNSFNSTVTIIDTDTAIQARALEVAAMIAANNPSRVKEFDIWHSLQSKLGGARGAPPQDTWYRVAEKAQVVFIEEHDRWYQDKVGIMHDKVQRALLPIGLGIQSEDRLIQSGTNRNYLVIDIVIQSGLEYAMLKIDTKAFLYPPATLGTRRLLNISCQAG